MTLSRAINVKISNGLRHFKRLGEKWDSVLWGPTKLRLDWGSIFTTVIFFWFYNSWKEFCFFKMLLFLQMMIRAVLWTIFASWCIVSNFDNCTMIRINLRDGHDTSGLTYNCITKHIGIFEHAYNSCWTYYTIIQYLPILQHWVSLQLSTYQLHISQYLMIQLSMIMYWLNCLMCK